MTYTLYQHFRQFFPLLFCLRGCKVNDQIVSLIFRNAYVPTRTYTNNTYKQRGLCILFSVVFNPSPPSQHCSVWVLHVISVLLTNTVPPVRACLIIGWESLNQFVMYNFWNFTCVWSLTALKGEVSQDFLFYVIFHEPSFPSGHC